MNIKEFEAMIRASHEKRNEYFIKRIVDFEEVWSLTDKNGWVLTEDDSNKKLAPFWPAKEYAIYCAKNEWADCAAEKILLEDFVNDWLPGLSRDNIAVSIFFNNFDSITLPISELMEDINSELEDY